MINIENTYISYEELVNKIGEEIIQNRPDAAGSGNERIFKR